MNAFCLADKNHVMLETSYGKFDTLMNYKKTKKVICQMLVASMSLYLNSIQNLSLI